jgi:hypothetical protein
MEEHVAVHDHEAFCQQRPCQPQRIQAVGLREPRVLDELDAAAALAPDAIGLAPDDHRDVVDAEPAQRLDLTLEERRASGPQQTLRKIR